MQASSPPANARRSLLRLAAALWMVLFTFLLFLAVMAALYDYFPSDMYIANRIQEIDAPAFGGFVGFVNLLGSAWLYVPLTVALAIAFIARNAWLEGALVLATFAVRYVNNWAKGAVSRPRPSSDLIDVSEFPGGYAFPSAHTVGTAVLFGLVFFLLPALVQWRPLRWLLQAGCLLMVAAAGPARVYVGAHWPSDTLGGYLLALLFLIPAFAVILSLPSRGKPQ